MSNLTTKEDRKKFIVHFRKTDPIRYTYKVLGEMFGISSATAYDTHQRAMGNKEYISRRAEKGKEPWKKWNRSLRIRILDHYGRQCVCCGEKEERFLCVDHVNGGGNKERRVMGHQRQILVRIIRNNFPPEYQILCFNCNWAKAHGGCPHSEKGGVL